MKNNNKKRNSFISNNRIIFYYQIVGSKKILLNEHDYDELNTYRKISYRIKIRNSKL